jgi:dual specificity phosphatase 12
MVIDGLLLGGLHEAFDRSLLVNHAVTHILNVASECNIKTRVDLTYAKHGVPDDCDVTDIRVILGDCMEFIDHARSKGGCVLVHCLEGVSRSACIVLCYLVKIKAWEPETALQHLRTIRCIVDPYPQYLAQTLEFCVKSQKK